MKRFTTFLSLLLALAFITGCVMPCPPCPEMAVEDEYQTRAPAQIPTVYYLQGVTTVGVDGTGYDVTFYSDTAGDYFLWDESAEALIITGTAAQDALNIADGNLTVVDNVVISGGTLDVTVGATTLEALTTGVAGTGADVQFFSDTSGDHLLWDASDEALEITGTSAQNALEIVEGNLSVSLGGLDVTAGATTLEALSTGVDGTGADVTFFSDTAGDWMLWDASDEALEITGTNAQTALDVADGNLVVTLGNATIAAGALDVTVGATSLEATTFGVDATGADVQFFSDTAGDSMLWDASDEALEITGTSAQNALEIVEGNLAVSLGGLDVTAGATTLEALSTGVAATGADVYFYSDTDGDHLFWDASDEVLNIIGTNAATALNVSDGNAVFADDIDVDGTANLDVVDIDGAVALAADVTMANDATGGNLGAKNEYIGLPRIKMMGVGTGSNPAAQTISLVDDTPDGEYAPVDASVVESLSTTVVKYGTNSYKMAWNADAVATDGVIDAGLGAAAAWDDMESCGMLVQSDTAWASGDLTLVLTDDGGARTYDIPALTTVNTWVWLEVDIATGDLSAVSDVAILMSAAGETALGAFNMYLDIMYVWDSVDEEALGVAIQQDGVLGVVDPVDGTNLVELTDYIVHMEDGVDFLVWVTDQSLAYPMILVAY